MVSGSLIQQLQSVGVKVTKRWCGETVFGDPYDVRCGVLAIVRTEADAESVNVDLQKQRPSVRTAKGG